MAVFPDIEEQSGAPGHEIEAGAMRIARFADLAVAQLGDGIARHDGPQDHVTGACLFAIQDVRPHMIAGPADGAPHVIPL
ncbi:hypothetical protein [uncultured Tateyamaria sp.]|uniref:hypothetical protein n=1 Tax=uncultured Tateyamaria sp. TaxID=455651 RepID=UPI002623CF31|nr:hypothetical protein [uncultured Tateyamaria sp.]